jgi:predicted RND superfamily exporter protein
MMATSIALTLAFLVFSLSTFVPVAHFGLLSAFIMGVDLVANIFLLPALMLTRRLWNR